MDAEVGAWLDRLPVESMDAIEISGDLREARPWRSFRRTTFPDLDLCSPDDPGIGDFDVVFCEQVLEHVEDPVAALRTLYRLTRPGGYLVVNTPFLLRIHEEPADNWRFTPTGLQLLLQATGFEVNEVRQWGNRTAVLLNLYGWTPNYGWLPRKNRPDCPVVVWAFARKARG